MGRPEEATRTAEENKALIGRLERRLADHFGHLLSSQPAVSAVLDDEVVGLGGLARAAQTIEVIDERLDEIRADLHDTNARLSLGVRDMEARARGIVEPHGATRAANPSGA